MRYVAVILSAIMLAMTMVPCDDDPQQDSTHQHGHVAQQHQHDHDAVIRDGNKTYVFAPLSEVNDHP